MGEKPCFAPTGVILPPLRSSYVNIIFTVGYVRVAHFTHGWGPSAATRLCRTLIGRRLILLLSVGCALFECLPTAT